MRNLIFCLMATVLFVACDVDLEVNTKNVKLTDITIECINETTISNNTSSNEPFTKHTYLCKGLVGGFTGDCYIVVMHDNFIVHNNHHLTIAGETIPFEFTFAPEWGYLDQPNNNFIVMVCDTKGDTLCKTTVVVTKHPESTTTM